MTCHAIYWQKARTKSKDIDGSDRLTGGCVCQSDTYLISVQIPSTLSGVSSLASTSISYTSQPHVRIQMGTTESRDPLTRTNRIIVKYTQVNQREEHPPLHPKAPKCDSTAYCTPNNILRAQVLLQLSTQQAKLIYTRTSNNIHSNILKITTRYPTQQPFKLQPPVQCVPVTYFLRY
jgi:hypothetical protein